MSKPYYPQEPLFESYDEAALDIATIAGHLAQTVRGVQLGGDLAGGEREMRQQLAALRAHVDQMERQIQANPSPEVGSPAYDAWFNRSAPDPDVPGGQAA